MNKYFRTGKKSAPDFAFNIKQIQGKSKKTFRASLAAFTLFRVTGLLKTFLEIVFTIFCNKEYAVFCKQYTQISTVLMQHTFTQDHQAVNIDDKDTSYSFLCFVEQGCN